MPSLDMAGAMGMAADHHVGDRWHVPKLPVDLRKPIWATSKSIPETDQPFHATDDSLLHRFVLVKHRTTIAVLGHARVDGCNAT